MRILVAALTFRRPETLRQMLDAWQALDLPVGAEVIFAVVDNDAEGSARKLVEAYGAAFAPRRLAYAVEPQPGIPAARNHALKLALDEDCDLLCFIDDDAHPDGRWLTELTACQRSSGATLVFGPVRLVAPAHPISPLRRLLARSIVARAAFLERYSSRRAAHGQTVTSGTGNWLADLDWVRRTGVRFDDALTGGGEDAAFREAVRERGGRFAWCKAAIVHEHLPPERVSVRYQFQRARAHGIIAARLGLRPRFVALRYPTGRIVAGALLMVLPIFGFASFAVGLHQVGMGFGLLQARRGALSTLYRR